MPAESAIVIGLTAVIFAVEADRAFTLVRREAPERPPALPFGPFDPNAQRTFELALRSFVRDQTGFELGYVEQLYTFGDRGRDAPLAQLEAAGDRRVVSVSYLGLAPAALSAPTGDWASWYRFFPWEDWRSGRPALFDEVIAPDLRAWADAAEGQGRRLARWMRARSAFGLEDAMWNEERVLDRYELLYEAGLVEEAARDAERREAAAPALSTGAARLGEPMESDHRRILATAIQRLRGKIKYRPVIFELVPERFTLSDLQRAVETLLGLRLHKQNFRRALASSGLVEGTGVFETATGGRPAELHRFRRSALADRPALGVAAPRLREG